jgi:hypothetical protein
MSLMEGIASPQMQRTGSPASEDSTIQGMADSHMQGDIIKECTNIAEVWKLVTPVGSDDRL